MDNSENNKASNNEVLKHTTDIVASFLTRNATSAEHLPDLISTVHKTLTSINAGGQDAPEEKPEPAVAIRKSVTPDFIICLEDGKKLKMLKRHLNTSYNMTPEDYRAKWGLPSDYPMVAPNYAKQRSSLAKKIGLGRGGRGKA